MYLCEPRHWEIDRDPLAWLWSQAKHHIENLILKSEKLEKKNLIHKRVIIFGPFFLTLDSGLIYLGKNGMLKNLQTLKMLIRQTNELPFTQTQTPRSQGTPSVQTTKL